MSEHRLIYSTWPDSKTAEAAAAKVVEAGLAACANILPGMTSVFLWEGKSAREVECAMILKTSAAAAPALIAALAEDHPYELPALVALDLDEAASSAPFLAWIGENSRAPEAG